MLRMLALRSVTNASSRNSERPRRARPIPRPRRRLRCIRGKSGSTHATTLSILSFGPPRCRQSSTPSLRKAQRTLASNASCSIPWMTKVTRPLVEQDIGKHLCCFERHQCCGIRGRMLCADLDECEVDPLSERQGGTKLALRSSESMFSFGYTCSAYASDLCQPCDERVRILRPDLGKAWVVSILPFSDPELDGACGGIMNNPQDCCFHVRVERLVRLLTNLRHDPSSLHIAQQSRSP